MSILIDGMTAKQLDDVFSWARIGANNCMIGYGVTATELPDHGDLIDRDALNATDSWEWIRHGAPVVIPAERSE